MTFWAGGVTNYRRIQVQSRVKHFSLVLPTAAAGLLLSCEPVCACVYPPPSEIVYGSVESSAGAGVPSAVINYRRGMDSVCVFDSFRGEILANSQGRFRGEVFSFTESYACLELRAYDPASKIDTVSILLFVDFAAPDSTGVVLRLP